MMIQRASLVFLFVAHAVNAREQQSLHRQKAPDFPQLNLHVLEPNDADIRADADKSRSLRHELAALEERELLEEDTLAAAMDTYTKDMAELVQSVVASSGAAHTVHQHTERARWQKQEVVRQRGPLGRSR